MKSCNSLDMFNVHIVLFAERSRCLKIKIYILFNDTTVVTAYVILSISLVSNCSVQKDPKSGDLHVASHVLRVRAESVSQHIQYPLYIIYVTTTSVVYRKISVSSTRRSFSRRRKSISTVRKAADYSRIGAYRTCAYGKEFPCEQNSGDVSQIK